MSVYTAQFFDHRGSSVGYVTTSEKGLVVAPEDDFYQGVIPPAVAVRLARAILDEYKELAAEITEPV